MGNTESPSELFREFVQGLANYVKALAADLAKTTGKKLGLFAAASTCLMLALIYLSMALINWLTQVLMSPVWPYVIVGGILLLAAAILFMVGFGKKPKEAEHGDEEAHEETPAAADS